MVTKEKTKEQLVKEIKLLKKEITELKKLEPERKKGGAKTKQLSLEWRNTFNSISDMVFIIKRDFTIVKANRAFTKVIKSKSEDIIGRKCYKLVHKLNKPWPSCPFKMSKKDKRAHTQEIDDLNIGVPLSVSTSPILDKNGKVAGAVHIVKDITERKKMEETLREHKEKFSAMLESLSDHVSMLDKDLNILWANKTAKKMFGSDIIGKKCYQVYYRRKEPCEPYPCLTLKAFKDGKVHENDTQVMDKHGEIVYLHCSANVALEDKDGKPTAVLEIFRDITGRKKAEEDLKKAYKNLKDSQGQLIQSEKMATVGRISTGVAHEINNPLTVISGEAEMLLKDKDKDKETKDASGAIVEQVKRIKSITEKLLDFSRKKEFVWDPLDINRVLEESTSLLSCETKLEEIEIVKELAPDLSHVLGDNNQIQEVFLNIMLNAVQAMKKRGKLTANVRLERIKKPGENEVDIFKPGQKIVAIEFKDTGKGIKKEMLRQIFEPFFSTKTEGTGLGLSICSRIIKKHNGTIEVQSRFGKGSTFIVKLPVAGGER